MYVLQFCALYSFILTFYFNLSCSFIIFCVANLLHLEDIITKNDHR